MSETYISPQSRESLLKVLAARASSGDLVAQRLHAFVRFLWVGALDVQRTIALNLADVLAQSDEDGAVDVREHIEVPRTRGTGGLLKITLGEPTRHAIADYLLGLDNVERQQEVAMVDPLFRSHLGSRVSVATLEEEWQTFLDSLAQGDHATSCCSFEDIIHTARLDVVRGLPGADAWKSVASLVGEDLTPEEFSRRLQGLRLSHLRVVR